jgi:predicted  nucleic acid-binding Zn-ribbon protein
MREIAAFDADLAIQTAEAKRLKEQLLVLRDNQERTTSEAEGAAKEVQRVRKELEAVLKERMREVGEMKEGKEAREEVERVKGMLQRAREEVEGLERWKEGHECGGYVFFSAVVRVEGVEVICTRTYTLARAREQVGEHSGPGIL